MLSKAVKIVTKYFESQQRVETDTWIKYHVFRWYDSANMTNPYLIAAAVIYYGNYKFDWSEQEIENLAETLYHKYS